MDMLPCVERVEVVDKTSSKTGSLYQQLEVTFVGGYTMRQFLNDDTKFILKTIYDQNQ